MRILFALLFLLHSIPATPVRAADEFVFSELSSDKSKEQRAAFSDWISGDDFEILVEEQKQKGKFLIYVEGNGKFEYRGIFGEVEPRGWYYTLGSTEESFIDSHRRYTSNGLKLMTLTKSRSDRYGAIWIHERSFDALSAQLEKYGISLASVSKD